MRLPSQCQQAVLSTAINAFATEGEIQRFERRDGAWQPVGAPIAVRFGDSGLAWGVGYHGFRRHQGPGGAVAATKADRDGRSVLGIYDLGPAFGYAAVPPEGVQLPYRRATERDFFVRDAESSDYNRWCTIPAEASLDPQSRWRVYEPMLRSDDQYELGLLIGHNMQREPGLGGSTFLHVWAGPNQPTEGGVGMARSDMIELMRWLDMRTSPLFIQGLWLQLHRLYYAQ